MIIIRFLFLNSVLLLAGGIHSSPNLVTQAYTSKRCILIQVLPGPNVYTKSGDASPDLVYALQQKYKKSKEGLLQEVPE